MKAVLVTGGCGFIGSHFVRVAIEAGLRVVILDDLSGGSSTPLPRDRLTFVRGDIADYTLVKEILYRYAIEAVVHFAGKIQVGESIKNPALYFDTNLIKTTTFLNAVVAFGLKIVLFSSTAAVYGTPRTSHVYETDPCAPINPYGMSKLSAEYVLRAYGEAHSLQWAALRYFNAAGAHPDGTLRENHEPETHLIPLAIDAARGVRPPIGVFGTNYPTRDGTCVRDYVHVCDLVDAHLAALKMLEHCFEVGVVNLGTAIGSTVLEVLAACEKVLGVPVPHTIGERREGDPATLLADTTRAQERLNWKPQRSLLTIIADAANSR